MAGVRDFTFLTGTSIGSDSFCTVFVYNLFIFPNCGRIFGVPEVWWMFRLLQIVLFLTDSIFVALCAYFDESMDCIGGGISHGNVRIQ